MTLTEHAPSCPARSDPEVTCVCRRVVPLEQPYVALEDAVSRWGVAGVRKMLATGRLQLKKRVVQFWLTDAR